MLGDNLVIHFMTEHRGKLVYSGECKLGGMCDSIIVSDWHFDENYIT